MADYDNRLTQLDTGTITYNGFTFPPAKTVSYAIRPVYDKAGRTVKHKEIYIRVECMLSAKDLDAVTASAKAELYAALFSTLSTARGLLTLTNTALGDLTFTNQTDFSFGPQPKVVTFESVGAGVATHLVWECVATFVQCGSGGAIGLYGELSWEVSWDVNQDGMTTRTISGYYETKVQTTTQGGRQTGIPADYYWDQLQFPRLVNFHRVTSRTMSANKKGMNFRITDTEIASDNPYYPGMLRMDIKQSVQAVGITNENLQMSAISIYGSITVAPGTPKTFAWVAFLGIVQARLAAITNSGAQTGGAPATLLITELSLEDDIYGRSVSFSIGWNLYADLKYFLTASGIWQPINNSNWNLWSTSMVNVQSGRGFAKLGALSGDDLIVDYCYNFTPSQNNVSVKSEPTYSSPIFSNECKCAWIRYHNGLSFQRETSTITQYAIASSEADATNQTNGDGLDGLTGGKISSTTSSANPAPISIQDRGSSSGFLVLSGYAVRLGCKIKAPILKTIGGKPAILKSEKLTNNVLLSYSAGCPVYGSSWVRTYHLPPDGVNEKDLKFENIPDDVKPPTIQG